MTAINQAAYEPYMNTLTTHVSGGTIIPAKRVHQHEMDTKYLG